jgi:hypothetical protein
MINLFIGHDDREAVGTHVFISSVLKHSSVPVSITPLHKPMLRRAFGGDVAEGTNAFTMSRFLIPFLMDWRGTAVFMDGADMLCRWDLADLESLRDPYKAVQVVQHDYRTNASRKYVGTAMESDNTDYPRKNWASVMLINCSHYAWRRMTPSVLLKGNRLEALSFAWCPDQYIGDLPLHWNWLVDEHGPSETAKVLHWTQGVPLFQSYSHMPHSDEWFKALKQVNHATD